MILSTRNKADGVASERATEFYDRITISSSLALSNRVFRIFCTSAPQRGAENAVNADAVGATSLGRVAAGSHSEIAAILQLVWFRESIHGTDTKRLAGNCENWSHATEKCGSITLATSEKMSDERQEDCRVQCRNKFSGALPEKLKLGIQPLLILNSRTSKFSR